MNYFILHRNEDVVFNLTGFILFALMNLSLQAMTSEISTHRENENEAINIVQAIELHRIDIVKVILENGQDPNERVNKVNPLLAAIYQDRADIVKLLLTYGARKVEHVREEDKSLITFTDFLERYATTSIKKILEDHFNPLPQQYNEPENRSKGMRSLIYSKILTQIFPIGIIFIIVTSIFEGKK